jgi:predicted nucleic acid-binding protein
MTLVDTNVLADVLTHDSAWYTWSAEALRRRAVFGALLINEVVYAELSVRADSEVKLDKALTALDVELARTPTPALFLAGKTFYRYRTAGGTRSGVLPDFFIGAHAQVARWPLLTRDVGRYRTYFPDVELIAPTA